MRFREYKAAAIASIDRLKRAEHKRFLLESEIDPSKIYQRAMVDGDLNKQTQKDIADAVERAKRAYEIATRSLFRDVSSYSSDKYKRGLASDLTLADLQRFSERFLAKERRQLQRKDGFLEFLVPEVLSPWELPERYRLATFDREMAIRRTDAEFLALGHPFVDALLEHVGSYDFGGLAAIRHIRDTKRVGQSGYLFIFVVRERIAREDSDECLFRFEPVFVRADGRIDQESVGPAISQEAISGIAPPVTISDADEAFHAARSYLVERSDIWEWIDDVEFLAMCWVQFI